MAAENSGCCSRAGTWFYRESGQGLSRRGSLLTGGGYLPSRRPFPSLGGRRICARAQPNAAVPEPDDRSSDVVFIEVGHSIAKLVTETSLVRATFLARVYTWLFHKTMNNALKHRVCEGSKVSHAANLTAVRQPLVVLWSSFLASVRWIHHSPFNEKDRLYQDVRTKHVAGQGWSSLICFLARRKGGLQVKVNTSIEPGRCAITASMALSIDVYSRAPSGTLMPSLTDPSRRRERSWMRRHPPSNRSSQRGTKSVVEDEAASGMRQAGVTLVAGIKWWRLCLKGGVYKGC